MCETKLDYSIHGIGYPGTLSVYFIFWGTPVDLATWLGPLWKENHYESELEF
jgi:hypothetical protein